MNIYRLLHFYQRVKSPRIKLLGILVLHLCHQRYLSVNIDPALSCNFRCKMCYFSDEKTVKSLHGRFSSDDLKAIARALFPRTLRLQIGCGAEPTISQNLLELVQLGKQYGVKHITITTNGNLLTYEKLYELVASGLTELTISAHGFTKNTYENLMVNGKFELFTTLIQNLKRIKTSFPNFHIRLNYTINADNAAELIHLKDIFKDINPDVIQIRPIQCIGDSAYNNFSLKEIENNYLKWIKPVIDYCKQMNITCIYPTISSLNTLDNKNGQEGKSNKFIDMLPYFYMAPYKGWKEKLDPYNENFEDYAKRTHRLRAILKTLIGINTAKEEHSKTKILNYQIK